MAHAETCPVCHGIGRTEYVEGIDSTTVRKSQPCHGCDGKGWVEVSDPAPAWPVQPPKEPTTYPYGLPPWFPIVSYIYPSDKGL